MILIFEGKMQSGKNRVLITRTGHRYPTKRFAEWRDQMVAQAGRQTLGVARGCYRGDVERLGVFLDPVRVVMRYTPGDLIRRDAPGVMDALWHVLERARVVADDALIQEVRYEQMPLDRTYPHCMVEIEPLTKP